MIVVNYDKIKAMFRNKGIGLGEFRDRNRIHMNSWSKLKAGKDVSLRYFDCICAELGCQPCDILERVQ